MTQTEIILILLILTGVGVAAFIAHAITVWREESARLERALKILEKRYAERHITGAPTKEYPRA